MGRYVNRYISPMPSQAERRETTIRSLLEAAQELFAERGFAETTVDDVVARAGLAKGALYHHFRSKEEVFAAVVDAMQRSLATSVVAASLKGEGAIDRLKLGCRAFLRACLADPFRRVVIVDGPAVMGWEAWRELDQRYFGALLTGALAAAMDEGAIARQPVEPLAALLTGAITEAAMVCARSAEPKRELRRLGAAFDDLVDRLRA
jgi:AcrR family transcriptional regulator